MKILFFAALALIATETTEYKTIASVALLDEDGYILMDKPLNPPIDVYEDEVLQFACEMYTQKKVDI